MDERTTGKALSFFNEAMGKLSKVTNPDRYYFSESSYTINESVSFKIGNQTIELSVNVNKEEKSGNV